MISRRAVLVVVACLLAIVRAHAVVPSQLLEASVQNWLGERNHWAFTQHAVEYMGSEHHERIERYDPSRPGDQRWELLAIDGKSPTPAQRRQWAEKKFKHHHPAGRFDTPLSEFFDFSDARIVAQTSTLVQFDVPLRTDKNWLFPVDKVDVRVTIDKRTHALEHLTAHVREPFRVLLGLAHVLGGDVDLNFLHFDDVGASPATAEPKGTARVSVTKLGERVDFTWSDFKRVTPHRRQGG
ncbi:MAG TPA: hypothetical protein VHE61_17510 [Opitutaceae bacterium]|nr:hypothetical protein [Opitutaceae bacterium]